ncbi:hypothetical protein Tco_0804932, partial [Tanacetum coccineum]
ESVRSSPSRIILFGTIPTEIPAETPTIPSIVLTLPHTSPFLYTDSFDIDTSERPPSQDPYEILPAPPKLTHQPAILVLPGRLASRYPPDHSSSDHFSSDDSSSNSSSDSSSDYSLDSSLGHSLPDSYVDAPAAISVGPSHKRCRSPAILVPLATPILGVMSLVCADLLPPRKRIRGVITASDFDDSIEESYEAYTEPDIDSDVQADIDVDTTAVEATAAREADVGVEVSIGSDGEDKVGEEAESRDRGTIKIGVDRVSDIESAQRERGCRMLAASEQRAGMLDRIGVLEMDNKRLRGMLCVERERVDSLRRYMLHTQEELRQMRVSRYYDRAEFRRLETFDVRHLGYHP